MTRRVGPPGVELWRGPSLVTGADVVAIVTFDSDNAKTGPMGQAWLLVCDVAPNEAIHTDADRAICGDCPHRANAVGRSCYVPTWLGPLNVWRAWRAGLYPPFESWRAPGGGVGGRVRLTAYGDAAAAPWEAWFPALAGAALIAYTSLWRSCEPRWRDVCMASVVTPEDRQAAQAAGWRTYRTRLEDEPLEADEIVCPASHEAGQRVTCDQCMLCQGGAARPVKAIAIQIHGTRARRFVELREGLPRYTLSKGGPARVERLHWQGRRTWA
jgi:hypothetical protein